MTSQNCVLAGGFIDNVRHLVRPGHQTPRYEEKLQPVEPEKKGSSPMCSMNTM